MDWKKTAQRLKELRLEKGLSHAKLKEVLEEKYKDISISELSLKKYEIAEDGHKYAKSVCGMKTEYLYYFADFYDVTADYLVGKSDCRKIVADEVLKKTGLSENALAVLSEHAEKNYSNDTLLYGLNYLIENEDFSNRGLTRRPSILSLITNYLFSGRMKNSTIVCVDEDGLSIKRRGEGLPHSLYLDVFSANIVLSNMYFERLNERLRDLRKDFQETIVYERAVEYMKLDKEDFLYEYFQQKRETE